MFKIQNQLKQITMTWKRKVATNKYILRKMGFFQNVNNPKFNVLQEVNDIH